MIIEAPRKIWLEGKLLSYPSKTHGIQTDRITNQASLSYLICSPAAYQTTTCPSSLTAHVSVVRHARKLLSARRRESAGESACCHLSSGIILSSNGLVGMRRFVCIGKREQRDKASFWCDLECVSTYCWVWIWEDTSV